MRFLRRRSTVAFVAVVVAAAASLMLAQYSVLNGDDTTTTTRRTVVVPVTTSNGAATDGLDEHGGSSIDAGNIGSYATAAAPKPPESMSSSNSTKPERLNIVLFYADDWTVNALGIFNNKVLTPNLDAMARRGIAFTHNCVTTSICWMSRATKYTGMYSSVHKQLSVKTMNMFDGTVRWNDTLYPKLFKAGYHTGHVGKWHAPMPKEYQRYTFNTFKNYYGSHWTTRYGKKTHVTECNRLDALEYLQSINGKLAKGKIHNFALTVAFFAPHAMDGNPWPTAYMPDDYTAPMYRNFSNTYPKPKTATLAAWKKMPWFFNDKSEARRRWRARFKNETYRQESIERVYRLLTEIDKAVGDVMQEVRNMGLYDKTLFIFTTDNGVFYGEHGLADKWYPHEESVRVPLIIEDPRMDERVKGSISGEFTLNVDLAPTILSAAGIEVPPQMQGRDMAALYTGDYETATTNWRKDFFYEFSWRGAKVRFDPSSFITPNPPVFALISKTYKYFYWPLKQYHQLFHVATDPFEERDVMNTTDHFVVQSIKARYEFLRNLSQSGHPV